MRVRFVVPTSRRIAPLSDMMSGMRKPSPISISSPRETIDFGIFRERVQDEENGGGVVVDDNRGFRADELRQQAGGVNVALAALAAFDIVFEIRIVSGGGGNRGRCRGGEWGAAEICVQDYAGGVDDVDERGREESFDVFHDARFDGGGIQRGGEIARARGGRVVRG